MVTRLLRAMTAAGIGRLPDLIWMRAPGSCPLAMAESKPSTMLALTGTWRLPMFRLVTFGPESAGLVGGADGWPEAWERPGQAMAFNNAGRLSAARQPFSGLAAACGPSQPKNAISASTALAPAAARPADGAYLLFSRKKLISLAAGQDLILIF